MDRSRPWWRGLDREVQEALAACARAGRIDALELAARLRTRLPAAEILRPAGADLAVAWDGVEGRREVRVLFESALAHEADFARVLGRVAAHRAPGRQVLVALHVGVAEDLALELCLSLAGPDPVIDSGARVVDLTRRQRASGAPSGVRTASG